MSRPISVTVHLHTTLQQQTPQGLVHLLQIEVPTGSTVGDLLHMLDITTDLQELLLVVNGRVVEASQSLTGGDEVHFIPAISGGSIGIW